MIAELPDEDALVALTNRGTVLRARRELERADAPTVALEREGDLLRARWSDRFTVTVPHQGPVTDARCTCPASDPCVHLVRTVLHLRRTESDPASERPASLPGDPGALDDERLATHYSPTTLRRVRRELDTCIVELSRRPHPVARFYRPDHTVHFPIAGDLLAARCDCDTAPPCRHIALAILAFRRLPDAGARSDGGLFVGPAAHSGGPSVRRRDEIEDALVDLATHGADALSPRRSHISRLVEQLFDDGHLWLADALEEVARHLERYRAHDPRFAPGALTAACGEIIARLDALGADPPALPPLLVAGDPDARARRLGASRWTGVGCTAHRIGSTLRLETLLVEDDSGRIVALGRSFDAADAERPLHELAGTPLVGDRSVADVARGLLTLEHATLDPDHLLDPGGAPAGIYPQSFDWERLPPPARVDGFGAIIARLLERPPSTLRPRRAGEDLFVCPVDSAHGARFSERHQSIIAHLLDPRGARATLEHPVAPTARAGAARLLEALRDPALSPHRLAAIARPSPDGPRLAPTAVVFTDEDGHHHAVLPWIDRPDGPVTDLPHTPSTPRDPMTRLLEELAEATGALLLHGARHTDPRTAERWRELAERARELGTDRIGSSAASIARALSDDHETADRTTRFALRAALLVRLARDLG